VLEHKRVKQHPVAVFAIRSRQWGGPVAQNIISEKIYEAVVTVDTSLDGVSPIRECLLINCKEDARVNLIRSI
jgi:hypothetical protein